MAQRIASAPKQVISVPLAHSLHLHHDSFSDRVVNLNKHPRVKTDSWKFSAYVCWEAVTRTEDPSSPRTVRIPPGLATLPSASACQLLQFCAVRVKSLAISQWARASVSSARRNRIQKTICAQSLLIQRSFLEVGGGGSDLQFRRNIRCCGSVRDHDVCVRVHNKSSYPEVVKGAGGLQWIHCSHQIWDYLVKNLIVSILCSSR